LESELLLKMNEMIDDVEVAQERSRRPLFTERVDVDHHDLTTMTTIDHATAKAEERCMVTHDMPTHAEVMSILSVVVVELAQRTDGRTVALPKESILTRRQTWDPRLMMRSESRK
jgi:hypothetical protein